MNTTPAPAGSDSIRAEFDDNGRLTLHCGLATFERLRDLLAAEGGGLKAMSVSPEEVEEVIVVCTAPLPEPPPWKLTWTDRVLMCGCFAIPVACFVVFCIGLATVGNWIKG